MGYPRSRARKEGGLRVCRGLQCGCLAAEGATAMAEQQAGSAATGWSQ